MKVFLNSGHAPNGNPDPGACGNGLRECDVAKDITDKVEFYLVRAGIVVGGNLQSDDLAEVVECANLSGANLFISIHCNSFSSNSAKGTEVCVHPNSESGHKAGQCIQNQIVQSLDTIDRGLKDRPNLYVLKNTDMPAVLVETAFISNEDDAYKLKFNRNEFARAIARGVTDYMIENRLI